MKFKVYKYKSLTSTNDKAINFINSKKKESGFIFSNIQTKGRGTREKKWISLEGNLFASIFFPLKKNYPSFNEFTFINPIIIHKVIKSFCKKSQLNLKWPNDILLNKKKICGILQEVIKKNNLNYLIIGVGLNLVKNPNMKGLETSNILKETNINIKKGLIINKIVKSYELFFNKIKNYEFKEYKKKANLLSIQPSDLKWN